MSDTFQRWINASCVKEENVFDSLKGVNGILIPGGFGDRGIEGKISAIKSTQNYLCPSYEYLVIYKPSHQILPYAKEEVLHINYLHLNFE